VGLREDVEAFRERLVSVGLAARADALAALARPSILLKGEPVDDASIEIGMSKLGGCPDLPADFVWPSWRGLAQSFIAQINLDECQGLEATELLPSAGLLSFFYDSEQRVWGFDPAEDGAWAVYYTPETRLLSRRNPPDSLPEEGRYGSKRLVGRNETAFAPWELSEVDVLGLTREERSAYGEMIESETSSIIHRLLGHPDPVQGDMQMECQLVSHGLYCGDSSGYRDPRAEALRPGATEWRLLLQIDTDDDVGMMWGDVGRIYYWLRRDALVSRQWDRARFVLQCG
jgi:uncharacterized protein YwqG